MRAVGQAVWAPAAPISEQASVAQRWWVLTCVLVVVPLTAVLHHMVFFRPTCILNPFGEDYTPAVVARWLSADPSPWIAAAGVTVLYFAGRRLRVVRLFVAPILAAGAYAHHSSRHWRWGWFRPRTPPVGWYWSQGHMHVAATLPVSVWLWDIPFSGRVICHAFHDGRIRVLGLTVGTRHIYLLCAVLYAILLWLTWRAQRRRVLAPRQAEAASP